MNMKGFVKNIFRNHQKSNILLVIFKLSQVQSYKYKCWSLWNKSDSFENLLLWTTGFLFKFKVFSSVATAQLRASLTDHCTEIVGS